MEWKLPSSNFIFQNFKRFDSKFASSVQLFKDFFFLMTFQFFPFSPLSSLKIPDAEVKAQCQVVKGKKQALLFFKSNNCFLF